MRRFFTALLLCIGLFVSEGIDAAQLHLVMVGDTASADIGKTVHPDLMHMHDTFSDIAEKLAIPLHEKLFFGAQVNFHEFFEEIAALEIESDDLVIFFFSGHGVRSAGKAESNPWPDLYFSLEKRGIDFLTVIDQFREKKPRLLLAIVDSCNDYLPTWHQPAKKRMRYYAARSVALPVINAHWLFMQPAGEILIAAASPAEKAWASRQSGGIFTSAFVFELSRALASAPLPDWGQILVDASVWVSDKQTPFYILDIR